MDSIQKYNTLCLRAQTICNKIHLDNSHNIARELKNISSEIDILRMKEEKKYIDELIYDNRINEILTNIINESDILLLCVNKKIIREMHKYLLYDIMNYIGGYNQNTEENIIELVCFTEFIFNKKSKMFTNGCLVYRMNKKILRQISMALNLYAKPHNFFFDINKITNNNLIIDKFNDF